MNADLNRRTGNNGFAQSWAYYFQIPFLYQCAEPLQAILGEPYI
jgi:hypothetical protein